MSQYPGDAAEAVELRMRFFERYTDSHACQAAPQLLKTLMLH